MSRSNDKCFVGLQLVGPQQRFALGNKSSKVLSVNHYSVGDFGIFNGSVSSGHDLGGGFPYFCQAGHSSAVFLRQIPTRK